MDKLKYGIMGGASIVPRFVAGLNESPGSRPYALATRSLEKSRKMAGELNIPVVHESYESLVKNPELDIIYIPLWNKGHYAGAKLALDHGKNVLLEKPFTLKVSEAEELFALAAKNKVFLMEAQKAVFLPVTKKVKELIDSGAIGEVEWVDIQQSHPGVEVIPWFDDVSVGGGAYVGSASYPLSVLQYWFGARFDSVDGRLTNLPNKSDNKGQVVLTKGKILISSLIVTAFQLESRMVLHGTKGRITIPNYWKADKLTMAVGSDVQTIEIPRKSEFVYEIMHVEECLRSGRLTSPVMTPEMTIANGAVVEKLYQQTFGTHYLS